MIVRRDDWCELSVQAHRQVCNGNAWAMSTSAKLGDDVIKYDGKLLAFFRRWAAYVTPLMEAQAPDILLVDELADVVSFLSDAPVRLLYCENNVGSEQYLQGLDEYYREMGMPAGSMSTIFNTWQDTFHVDSHGLPRFFASLLPGWKEEVEPRAWTLTRPQSDDVRKALHAYRVAVAAIQPSMSVLGFFRVLEVLGRDPEKPKNRQNDKSLIGGWIKKALEPEAVPIWVYDPTDLDRGHFDLSGVRRQHIKRHVKEVASPDLLDEEGIYKIVWEWRNETAHADIVTTTKIGRLPSLLEVHVRADLVRLAARCAIESRWRECG